MSWTFKNLVSVPLRKCRFPVSDTPGCLRARSLHTSKTTYTHRLIEKTTATRTPRCPPLPPGAPTKPTRFLSAGFLSFSLLPGIALTQQHKSGFGNPRQTAGGLRSPDGGSSPRAPEAPGPVATAVPSVTSVSAPSPSPTRLEGDPPVVARTHQQRHQPRHRAAAPRHGRCLRHHRPPPRGHLLRPPGGRKWRQPVEGRPK